CSSGAPHLPYTTLFRSRHLEGLAVLVELHQLRELDVQRHPPVRERRDHRLQPLDIAAVVGTEDVDQLVETAIDLVPVIGDVGGRSEEYTSELQSRENLV